MDAAIAEIFVESAKHVYEKALEITLKRHSLVKKTTPYPSLPISIVIGMTGMIKGQVIYSISEDTAFSITKAMLPKAYLPVQIRKYQNGAVGEIANMITGHVGAILSQKGVIVDITPPSIIVGRITVDYLEMEAITLKMNSTIGQLEINIAMSNSRSD